MTPELKAIADAHIQAKIKGQFDDPHVESKEQIIRYLQAGKTFSEILRQVEVRYVSITSNILASSMDYQTDAYRRGVYKGFKALFSQVN